MAKPHLRAENRLRFSQWSPPASKVQGALKVALHELLPTSRTLQSRSQQLVSSASKFF